jgi:hypothetical protein
MIIFVEGRAFLTAQAVDHVIMTSEWQTTRTFSWWPWSKQSVIVYGIKMVYTTQDNQTGTYTSGSYPTKEAAQLALNDIVEQIRTQTDNRYTTELFEKAALNAGKE